MNLYWTKKELKKHADSCPLIFMRINTQRPITSSHLLVHKLTGGKLPKSISKKNIKPKFSFECPLFMTITNSNISNKFPKKINNYILHSRKFFRDNLLFYSLTFPTCYEKVYANSEDSGNNPDWYLILSNSEKNLENAISEFNKHPLLFMSLTPSQKISSERIEDYLKELKNIRPEFAEEIQLYLEVTN